MLLLAACQKEETDTFDIPDGALMLTTEGFSNQDGSKTSVNGTAVHWVNGDRIRINGTPGYVTTGSGANADKAYATGDWNLSTGVHAFYPADIVDQQYWNSDNPQVNFPNRFASSFDGSGRQIIGLPMVGRAPANASGVKFLHLSAAINVRVRNNTGRAKLYIDSVTVSSASQQLCGIANVTFRSGGIYSIIGTGLTANNMSVTVYFPDPEADSYLANGEIRDVQVPIYPTVAGELTFKVYCHTRADEEIHVGLCPAHIEYNYSRTLSNNILNRNVMATAQIAVTDDGYTTRIDHGFFTASNGRQVRFSQGNLLCHRGYPWYTGQFSFQAHQYIPHPEHHLANGNGQNVGINYENDASNDWNIGLFGWGTSGYQHSWGWSYSPSSTEDGDGYHEAYFKTKRNLFEPDYGNPAVADWGYAAITNGGNAENAGWFTPSKEDWQAIVFSRPASTVALHDFWGNADGTCANARFVRAQVENSSRQPVKGLILFPDNFVDPFGPDGLHAMQYVNNTTDHTNWNEPNVYYSNSDWFRMEAAGAVFLPASSWRCGRKVDGWVFVSNNGAQVNEHEGVGGYPYTYSEGLCQSFYWSSSVKVSYDAYGLAFAEGHPVEIIPSWRYIGHPVRLIFADNGHGQWGSNGLEGYGDQGNAW